MAAQQQQRGAMIGFRLDWAKSHFFDRGEVQRAVAKAERKVLSAQGALVRKIARRLVRPRLNKTSRPGQPPHSHAPHLLRKGILFAWDGGERSVVVGVAKINKPVGNVPEVLEHGGLAELYRVRRPRGRGRVVERERFVMAARPFMGPALEKAKPKLASFWRDKVK